MVWQRSPRFASLTTPRYVRGAPIGRAAFHEGCNYRRKLLFRHEPPLRKGGMKGGIVYLLAPMGSYRNARESLFTRLTRARGTEGFARIGKTTGLAGGWLFVSRQEHIITLPPGNPSLTQHTSLREAQYHLRRRRKHHFAPPRSNEKSLSS